MFSLRILFAAFLPIVPVATAAEPAPRWWKGNLHTHSLWSDGDDYPEMIADWYKRNGYHFLALSDHNTLQDRERWIVVAKTKGGAAALGKYTARFPGPWVETRGEGDAREVRLKMLSEFRREIEEPGVFLMIQSEEITDNFLSTPIHMNATNVREKIEPQHGRTVVEVMRNNLAAVLAQRERTGVPMFAHVNHPNFRWAITAEEIAEVDRERFFEVYNGHPLTFNEGDGIRAGTERIWDIVLVRRLAERKGPIFGVATDDSHNYHGGEDPKKHASRPGRGWVMVRSAALSAEGIVTAMEAADFYASCGVVLRDAGGDAAGVFIEIDAEPGVTYRTEFIGTRRGLDTKSEPVLGPAGETLRTTRRYSKDIGLVLATVEGASARYTFRGDELYVRARVTSSKVMADPPQPGELQRAWTQPVFPSAR